MSYEVNKLELEIKKLKSVLLQILEKQQEKEKAEQQQDLLVKDEKLNVFYTTLRKKMNDYLVGAKAVSSGFVETRTNSTTGKLMMGIEMAGRAIPIGIVGSVVASVGATGKFISKQKEERSVKRVADLFLDTNVGAEIIEKVSRDITLGNNQEYIKNIKNTKVVQLYADYMCASLINHLQSGNIQKETSLEEQLVRYGKNILPQRNILGNFRRNILSLAGMNVNNADTFANSNMLNNQIAKEKGLVKAY